MGLDQYAYYCDAKAIGDREVDFDLPEDLDVPGSFKPKEFFYWRKHPNLQGWMQALYKKKGGSKEFNCVPVVLTESDLSHLEVDILRDNLPSTSGFFYGRSDGDEEEMKNDLNFIKRARELVVNGYAVYYTSWW